MSAIELAKSILINSSSLKAYYRFEGNSTDEIAAQNGTDSNVAYGTASGKFGQGAEFNGTTSSISVASTAALTNIFAAGGTVAYWVYPKSDGENDGGRVYDKTNNGTCGTASFTAAQSGSNVKIAFYVFHSTLFGSWSTPAIVPVNAWSHVVITYTSGNSSNVPSIYINGVKQTIGVDSIANGTYGSDSGQALNIGNRTDGARCFDGFVDDLAFYTQILTADQIKELYEGRIMGELQPHGTPNPRLRELNTTIFKNLTDLKLYNRFESGDELTDSSGNNHGLTAIASPTYSAAVFGQGANLASSSAYSIADHADLKPTTNWTIGAYFKTATTGTVQSVFDSFAAVTNLGGILMQIQATNVLRVISGRNTGTTIGTDYQGVSSTTNVCDNTWHLGIATWDGSYLRLYIDGKCEGSVAWSYAPGYQATNYVRIGCNYSGGNTNFLTGSLDDVFLLNGKALSSTEIQELYYQDAPPVSIWHLNGNSTDFSGNNNHGTDTAITYSMPNGKINQGAGFNGTSSKIVIADATSLKPTAAFTIAEWVKTTTSTASARFFQSYSANTSIAGIALTQDSVDPTKIRLFSGKNTGTVLGTDYGAAVGATTVTDGNWHFIVGTWDKVALRVYVDGKLDGTTLWSIAPVYAATNYVRIGCGNGAGTDSVFYTGAIDEVLFFNIAKDIDWIRKQYMMGKGIYY